MDYKSALSAIRKLDADDVDELVSAIETHVSGLEEKSFNTIGESRKNAARARATQEAINAIGSILGISGDDLESQLESKVKEIADTAKTATAKVSELESRATAAEAKAKELQGGLKLNEVAATAGADVKVLRRLLGDKIDEMTVENSTVKLGDKSLKEYVEADEELKPFAAALFPSAQPESKPAPKLPSGSPDGKPPQSTNPVDAHIERNYGGIKALTGSK